MKIYIVPMGISGFSEHNVAVRMRKNEKPVLFMQHVCITLDGQRENKIYSYSSVNKVSSISMIGDIDENVSLQDGDALLIQMRNNPLHESIEVHLQEKNGIYISEGADINSISIAATMEERLCVCIADTRQKDIVSTGVQIFNKAKSLYAEFPAFRSIMTKDEDGSVRERSLLSLVATQDEEFIKWAENMILAMDAKYKTVFSIAKQILEQSKTTTGFSLLSKEEQVAAFLEFSRKHADKAREAVSDELIDFLTESPEYQHSLKKMKEAGLGESPTQQFNVLQQVGYFGGKDPKISKGKVIYNLSDMGAGKTLMTAQAIFVLDCINLGVWNRTEKNKHVEVDKIYVPDKHIIAPALSIKASWVDTFKYFYDVERVDDYHYVLTMEFGGTKAISDLYVAPFTVKSGKVFVHQTLPDPTSTDTYLIVDEIHQLVRRRISRTKFFVPKVTPVERYRIFSLSGTMSNLLSAEWLSLIRFLGDTGVLHNPSTSRNKSDSLFKEFRENIQDAARDIETVQHRKFCVSDVSAETRYEPNIKKKTVVDESYFMEYGSKLLVPHEHQNMSVQLMLTAEMYNICVEPEENDNVSFELFYQIAAKSAITAESLQIAEELFGEQATQHKSSIIKTMSPFTDEEIMLLDTLHKIAADSVKYRSDIIGRDINNAILNINDGLQQKDLYTLIAGYAERNSRFLEYLAGLDIDILERLKKTSLIRSPKLEDTHKFQVFKELLEKDKNETFLIVVNDFYAMKTLAEALGVSYLSKQQLKDEMGYQEMLDELFEKQSVVIVTQDMIKSSLDLVQANRLIQYQLNTEVSDIIQTQNRINRIGQMRETKCYYIAADRLQNTLIELFLDSYRNIRVAHKGIVELFADLSNQIDVINDYLNLVFKKLNEEKGDVVDGAEAENGTDLMALAKMPENVREKDGVCSAILLPGPDGIAVIVPLVSGNAFKLGILRPGLTTSVTGPTRALWNIRQMKLVQ